MLRLLHLCGVGGEGGAGKEELLAQAAPLRLLQWCLTKEGSRLRWESLCVAFVYGSCEGCSLRRCCGGSILTGATILNSSCGTFYCVGLAWGGNEGPAAVLMAFVAQPLLW